MKVTITTNRLAGKYEQGEVIELSGEKDVRYNAMMALIEQGEAELEGAPKKKAVKKTVKKVAKKVTKAKKTKK